MNFYSLWENAQIVAGLPKFYRTTHPLWAFLLFLLLLDRHCLLSVALSTSTPSTRSNPCSAMCVILTVTPRRLWLSPTLPLTNKFTGSIMRCSDIAPCDTSMRIIIHNIAMILRRKSLTIPEPAAQNICNPPATVNSWSSCSPPEPNNYRALADIEMRYSNIPINRTCSEDLIPRHFCPLVLYQDLKKKEREN